VRNVSIAVAFGLLATASVAHAEVALFLEEPHGTFGDMNPTGHAAIYLSNVCAASLTSLRACNPGEPGVVISRYHRIGGYDWLAVPLIPYLYAVDSAADVPHAVSITDVDSLRDSYRRAFLESVAPDLPDGSTPKGDWTQLIGASYDRTIFSFELATTPEQDAQFIDAFNARRNKTDFHILFHNCADFARGAIDFYYPKAIHRSLIADLGIMTPKQAAHSLLQYSKKHPELQLTNVVIPQVPGLQHSAAVRGVVESLLTSKKYIVPLAPLAVLYPYFGGTLAFAWVEDGHFNPRHLAAAEDPATEPTVIAEELESGRVAPPPNVTRTSLKSVIDSPATIE
jgi:hypothetical protein